MQNVVIDFKVNNSEILETARMLEELGQVEQGTAEKFRKNSEANRKLREAEQQALIDNYRAITSNQQAYDRLNASQQRSNNTIAGGSAPITRTKREFDGLTNSINQLTRETPALTVSLNTFFLALSNNIPIFVDEVNKLKEANKELTATGQPTVSVIDRIAKSFFSWQTVISLAITALTMYGGKIIEFFTGMSDAEKAADALAKKQDELNKKIQENTFNSQLQIEKLQMLKGVLNDNTLSLKVKIGAYEELKTLIPTLNSLTYEEAMALGVVNYQIEREIKLIGLRAKAKGVEMALVEAEKKAFEEKVKRDEEARIAAEEIQGLGEQGRKLAASMISNDSIIKKGKEELLAINKKIYELEAEQMIPESEKERKAKISRETKEKKEKFKTFDEITKAEYEQQVKYTQDYYTQLQNVIDNDFINGIISLEEFNTKTKELKSDFFQKQLADAEDYAIANQDIEAKYNDLKIKNIIDANEKWLKVKKFFNSLHASEDKKTKEKTPEEIKRDEEKKAEIIFRATTDSIDAIRSIKKSALDEELAMLEEAFKKKEISESEYNARVSAAKNTYAEQDKKLAIFSILVNSAAAIIKAFANAPFPVAVAESVSIGLTTAAQIAAVEAASIPKFAKGTKNAPPGFKWVGEEGAELISTGGGETIMPHKKSVAFAQMFMDTPFPNLPQLALSNVINGSKGGEFDYRKLGKAIANELKNIPQPELNIHINNEVGKLNYNTQRYG